MTEQTFRQKAFASFKKHIQGLEQDLKDIQQAQEEENYEKENDIRQDNAAFDISATINVNIMTGGNGPTTGYELRFDKYGSIKDGTFYYNAGEEREFPLSERMINMVMEFYQIDGDSVKNMLEEKND